METTTGIYRNQCNIQFDHSTQGRLGKGDSQKVQEPRWVGAESERSFNVRPRSLDFIRICH